MVMRSFRYGSSGLLARLFRPRIDTLLFAASKADHVAYNQHNTCACCSSGWSATPPRAPASRASRRRLFPLPRTAPLTWCGPNTTARCCRACAGASRTRRARRCCSPARFAADLPSEEDWQAGRFRFRDFAPRRLRSERRRTAAAYPPRSGARDLRSATACNDRAATDRAVRFEPSQAGRLELVPPRRRRRPWWSSPRWCRRPAAPAGCAWPWRPARSCCSAGSGWKPTTSSPACSHARRCSASDLRWCSRCSCSARWARSAANSPIRAGSNGRSSCA